MNDEKKFYYKIYLLLEILIKLLHYRSYFNTPLKDIFLK